jgi:hypothetical protein
MTDPITSAGLVKWLEALKSVPWVVTLTIAITGALFCFVPILTTLVGTTGFIIAAVAAVFFFVFFAVQMLEKIVTAIYKAKPDKIFFLTPVDSRCHWSGTVKDGRFLLQIVASITVKNRSKDRLILTKARLVKPTIQDEMVNCFMSIVGSEKSFLVANSTAVVQIGLTLFAKKHVPRGDLDAVIGMLNDDGVEERVKLRLKDVNATTSVTGRQK